MCFFCFCCGLWEYHSLEIFLIFWSTLKTFKVPFFRVFGLVQQHQPVPVGSILWWFDVICIDLLLFSPLSMGARLVSKEWEIEILRWSRLITLNLYRMEPPASTRWDQIATGTPLKNASFQTLKTHKTQISKESWGPGSPFPWGNSKGEYFLFFLVSPAKLRTVFTASRRQNSPCALTPLTSLVSRNRLHLRVDISWTSTWIGRNKHNSA